MSALGLPPSYHGLERRRRRRANMLLRARVLGFVCGLGLVISSYTAGVLATDADFDGRLVLNERAILIYLVGPGAVLLFTVMGWFARGAYNTIDGRLRKIEDNYVARETWKETLDRLSQDSERGRADIDRLLSQRDRELDLLREQLKLVAGHNGVRT